MLVALKYPLRRRCLVYASVALLGVCMSTVSMLSAQAVPARAQVDALLQRMGRSHALGPVAVSPDGSMLAFTQHAEEGWGIAVAAMTNPTRFTRLTAMKDKAEKKDKLGKKAGWGCGEGMVNWAPDSRRLLFVGNCEPGAQGPGQDDVFVATISGDVAGGKAKFEVQKLTEAKGEVGFPYFSPDGTKVAFLYVEGATRAAGGLAAIKPPAGVIGEDGVEIPHLLCAILSDYRGGVK